MNPFLPGEIDLVFAKKTRPGALLFADVVGFTALSEKFSERGISGTGELTELLDSCFESILSVVRKHGGDIIEFIGDAILVKYENMDQAKKCSTQMIKTIKSFSDIETSAGKFSLSMKIVLGKGSWKELILGTQEKLLLFLTGNILKEMAKAGEKKALISFAKSAERRKMTRKTDLKMKFRIAGKKKFNPNIPIEISRKSSLGEFRSVACVFFQIKGYDEDNPDYEDINRIIVIAQKTAEKFGGWLNCVDNVRKNGSRILVLFGAPTAYGGEGERAVKFAMELTRLCNESAQISVCASAGAGFVFAGMIGDKKRKKYSVIGDAVNTTSRILDGLEKGAIVVTEDLFRMTKDKIRYSRLKSVRVKGKKYPLKRYRPESVIFETPVLGRFLGREEEIRRAREMISKGSCSIMIKGEPGIGKTRFLDELSRFAEKKGYKTFKTRAEENRPAFEPFAGLVRGMCAIEKSDGDSEIVFKIKKTIGERSADDKISSAGVLSEMFFGIESGDERFKKLNPEIRKQNLVEALLELMKSFQGKLCVVFDSFQWVKKEDFDVLDFIQSSLLGYSRAEVCFLMASRKDEFPATNIKAFENAKIEIGPMNENYFKIFTEKLLGDKKIEKSLLNTIMAKSDRNPFYAEQILFYLKDKKMISEKKGTWSAEINYKNENLPENLFSIIVSRIEKIGESAKDCLKVASAVGMNFRAETLENVLKKSVSKEIKLGVEAGILSVIDRGETAYCFTHALYKDVLYQTIISEEKKNIHGAIARYFEKKLNTKTRENLSLVSMHFDLSENWRKAYGYMFDAGLKSAEKYLNEEANFHFERALIIARDHLKSKTMEANAAKELANLCYYTGEYDKSLHWTSVFEKLSPKNSLVGSKVARFRSRCARGEKEFRKTLKSLEKNIKALKTSSQIQKRERIQNYISQAFLHRSLYEPQKALEVIGLAENELKKLDSHFLDDKIETSILQEKASAMIFSFDYANAMKYYEEAFNKAVKTGDKITAAASISNIGFIRHYKCEYEKALEEYQKAEEITREIGDNKGLCLSLMNLGCVYNDINKIGKSILCFEKSLGIALEMNFKKQIIFNYINLGNSYNNMRISKKAIEFTKKALPYALELNDYVALARINENLGNIYRKKGDVEKAIKHYNDDLKYLELSQDYKWMFYVLEKMADIEFDMMNYKKSLDYAKKALVLSRKQDYPEGQTDILMFIARLFLETGKYQKAEIYVKKAESQVGMCKDKEVTALYYINRAYFEEKKSKTEGLPIKHEGVDRVEELMNKALEIIEDVKFESLKLEYYYSWGLIFRERELLRESLQNLKEAMKLAKKRNDEERKLKVYTQMYLLYKKTDSQKARFFYEKARKALLKTRNYKRVEWLKNI
ncbi:tetratricopeptide repeat protein [candidate division WOR-3 bacterium]|nr:tetratricopeptide repeat protein [candidate division WOR-3 bacterium]